MKSLTSEPLRGTVPQRAQRNTEVSGVLRSTARRSINDHERRLEVHSARVWSEGAAITEPGLVVDKLVGAGRVEICPVAAADQVHVVNNITLYNTGVNPVYALIDQFYSGAVNLRIWTPLVNSAATTTLSVPIVLAPSESLTATAAAGATFDIEVSYAAEKLRSVFAFDRAVIIYTAASPDWQTVMAGPSAGQVYIIRAVTLANGGQLVPPTATFAVYDTDATTYHKIEDFTLDTGRADICTRTIFLTPGHDLVASFDAVPTWLKWWSFVYYSVLEVPT